MSITDQTGSTIKAAQKPISKYKQPVLYAAVWRWHFYAALYVLPFMFMLSLTGLIYLYQKPIENILYQDAIFVTQQGKMTAFEAQADGLKNTFPGAKINNFEPPIDASHTTKFDFKTKDNIRMIAYINPYNNQLLEVHERDGTLMRLLRKFHGELLMGRFGTKFVELAACWAIVLIITGAYLWWPRGGKGIYGTIIPRSGLKGRTWWKEWHSIIGIFAAILLVPILITGLAWTDVWGGSLSFIQKSTGQASLRDLRSAGKTVSNPNVDHLPMISAKAVIKIADNLGVERPYMIAFPKNDKAAFFISSRHPNPLKRRALHIDQYRGSVLKNIHADENPMIATLISAGIGLHQGTLFGNLNLGLATLAAILGLALSVSGFYAWWRRKPKGKLAAPRKAKNFHVGYGLWIIIGLCAILLPLMGASLMIIILLEKFVISKSGKVIEAD